MECSGEKWVTGRERETVHGGDHGDLDYSRSHKGKENTWNNSGTG